ncbi:MAG: adenylate/guanylate cyclase domain-containing protein [Nitrospinales bacterium]|nr:adenylate/guanylate cyclase domain-containing protein [Nitrospinales bacterium]
MNSKEKIINSRLSEDCLICGTFLTGFGGFLLGLTGLKRSSVNPNVCNRCNMHIEDGKIVEVSILFVDLCSFTSITHELGPEKTHSIVHSFLNTTTEAVIKHDGVVDKYIGDAVMALFNIPIQCSDHSANALAVTNDLTKIMPELSEKHGLELKFSAGLAFGAVRVGKLGSNDIKDFTAIGDAVNRASRLQAQARPGEIVLDTGAFQQVESTFPEIFPEEMNLKGFPATVLGYRIPIAANVKNPIIINENNKTPIRKKGTLL